MADLQTTLTELLAGACSQAVGSDFGAIDPLVRPAKDARFGDYQANVAMSLGKRLKQKPRDLAERIAEEARKLESIAKAEVAGPGFINLTLDQGWLERFARSMNQDSRLGVEVRPDSETVVVDYSSPNLAKEMHIGHLRSTIIGDAICRVLSYLGDDVVRQNHLGDWGTQFGMLLEHLIDTDWKQAPGQNIGDLNQLYRAAKLRFDTEASFAERARRRVVDLQSGEPRSLELWEALIGESLRHMNRVYERLGVLLKEQDIRPESAYNPELPGVVSRLDEQGLLEESEGARVVFPEGFKNREGDPLPLIVQKQDGGFGYAATDLAAADYRMNRLKATRLVYVVDARQGDHFQMVFSVLRSAGWVAPDVRLEHVSFGKILGKDNKPFQTREGDTVRLLDVLDQAVERAGGVLRSKATDLSPQQLQSISRAVGIGAVKYADLSSDRVKDYVFDWDRMLALEGNSAPYILNAYVRILSIYRKGEVGFGSLDDTDIRVVDDVERELVLKLLAFPDVVRGVGQTLELHRICGYLYELASLFHRFFERCPVLKAEPAVRDSRLALVGLVAKVLRRGLELLGLETIDRM